MLNLIILILILIGLIVHRHLTPHWEQGRLPYAMGFLTLANLFWIIYLVNFIWIFGLVLGIIIFALTFSQVIYTSFLWLFLLPNVISINKDQPSPQLWVKLTTVNPLIYSSFFLIVVGLGLLMIVNFFVSDYASLKILIVEYLNGNYLRPILWIVGIAVVSNIMRIFVLSKFLDRSD